MSAAFPTTTLVLSKSLRNRKFYWKKTVEVAGETEVIAQHNQGYSRLIDMKRVLSRSVFPNDLFLHKGRLQSVRTNLKIDDQTKKKPA